MAIMDIQCAKYWDTMKTRYMDIVIGTAADTLDGELNDDFVDKIGRIANWIKWEAVNEDIFKEDVMREIAWASKDYPKIELTADKIRECQTFALEHFSDYVKGIIVDKIASDLNDNDRLDAKLVEQAYQNYLYNDLANIFVDSDVEGLIKEARLDIAGASVEGVTAPNTLNKEHSIEM